MMKKKNIVTKWEGFGEEEIGRGKPYGYGGEGEESEEELKH